MEDGLGVTVYNVLKCGLYESRTSKSQGLREFFFYSNFSLSQQISLISIRIFIYVALLYNLVCLVCCLALFLLSLEEHNFIFSPFYVRFRVRFKCNPQNMVFTMSYLLEFEIVSGSLYSRLVNGVRSIPVLCQI